MKRYQLTVEGMSCSDCEERLQAAISQVAGVHRVEADRESNTIDVTAEENRADAVRGTVFEAGYDIPG